MTNSSTTKHTVMRYQNIAHLYNILAWQLSYPSLTQQESYSSLENIEYIASLLKEFQDLPQTLVEKVEAAKYAAKINKITSMRQEFTRLFITPPILVQTRGSKWVKEKTLIAQKFGESHAVMQYYRNAGLGKNPSVTEPADSLVSEIDFLSYIKTMEAACLEQELYSQAGEWHECGNCFVHDHFKPLALGASQALKNATNHPLYLLYAEILNWIADDAHLVINHSDIPLRPQF